LLDFKSVFQSSTIQDSTSKGVHSSFCLNALLNLGFRNQRFSIRQCSLHHTSNSILRLMPFQLERLT